MKLHIELDDKDIARAKLFAREAARRMHDDPETWVHLATLGALLMEWAKAHGGGSLPVEPDSGAAEEPLDS